MKTKFFLLLFICIYSTIGNAQDMNGGFISWSGNISLRGDWKGGLDDRGTDHRSISCIPISAFIENKTVSIDFWDMTGDVTITVTREDGPEVFSQSFYVNDSATSTIAIGSYSPGVYLLEFANQNDGYVSGWFEVK